MKKYIVTSFYLFVIHFSCFSQNYTLHQNILYDTINGVTPNLLAFDVYEPLNLTSLRPVIIYVHGGSWNGGSKTHLGSKEDLFTSQNYVFVSINYRLSPDPPDTTLVGAVRFPVHPRDVAKALSVIYDNIDQFHGDNQNMHFIGHSAGAHLINLVSTNEFFLNQFNLSPSIIGCTCLLDAGVYDVQHEIDIGDPARQLMLKSAFTTNPNLYNSASPLYQIQPNEEIPEFLIIHQNTPHRIIISNEFTDSLNSNGHSGFTFNADPYGHGQINSAVGHPLDTIGLTETVLEFFKNCSEKSSASIFEESTNKIKVYPNPTKGLIFVEIESAEQVSIFNSFGLLQKKDSINGNKIDLTGLSPGVYYLQFLKGNILYGYKKVIKL